VACSGLGVRRRGASRRPAAAPCSSGQARGHRASRPRAPGSVLVLKRSAPQQNRSSRRGMDARGAVAHRRRGPPARGAFMGRGVPARRPLRRRWLIGSRFRLFRFRRAVDRARPVAEGLTFSGGGPLDHRAGATRQVSDELAGLAGSGIVLRERRRCTLSAADGRHAAIAPRGRSARFSPWPRERGASRATVRWTRRTTHALYSRNDARGFSTLLVGQAGCGPDGRGDRRGRGPAVGSESVALPRGSERSRRASASRSTSRGRAC